jgi:hypothetical protein
MALRLSVNFLARPKSLSLLVVCHTVVWLLLLPMLGSILHVNAQLHLQELAKGCLLQPGHCHVRRVI